MSKILFQLMMQNPLQALEYPTRTINWWLVTLKCMKLKFGEVKKVWNTSSYPEISSVAPLTEVAGFTSFPFIASKPSHHFSD